MQKASIKEVLNGSDDTKFVTPKTLSKYFSTKQTGGGGDGVDTLPIGSIVEYDGDTVPDGYEEIDNSLNIITDGDAIKAGYKIDGKDVWVKRCTLGKLPNKTEIIYDVGITSSVAQIEDVKISATGGWQQVMPSMHTQVLLGPSGLAVATGANISEFYAIATLYFTYL